MGLAAFNRSRLKQAELAKAEALKQEKPVEAKEEKEPQNTAKKKKAAK